MKGKTIADVYAEIVDLVKRGTIRATEDASYDFKGFPIVEIVPWPNNEYTVFVREKGNAIRQFDNVPGSATVSN